MMGPYVTQGSVKVIISIKNKVLTSGVAYKYLDYIIKHLLYFLGVYMRSFCLMLILSSLVFSGGCEKNTANNKTDAEPTTPDIPMPPPLPDPKNLKEAQLTKRAEHLEAIKKPNNLKELRQIAQTIDGGIANIDEAKNIKADEIANRLNKAVIELFNKAEEGAKDLSENFSDALGSSFKKLKQQKNPQQFLKDLAQAQDIVAKGKDVGRVIGEIKNIAFKNKPNNFAAIKIAKPDFDEYQKVHLKNLKERADKKLLAEIPKLAAENDEKMKKEVELFKDITTYDGVKGLKNCGNTCYMNAVFQALFHTPELNRFLQVPFDKIPFAENVNKDQSLLKILHSTFDNYKNASEKGIVDTSSLANARTRDFPKGAQADAQEYMSAFIDKLGEELSLGKLGASLGVDTKNFTLLENYYKAGGGVYTYSLLDRWFRGFFKSTIEKDNGEKDITYESFHLLSLELKNVKDQSLDELYANYSKEEELVDSPGNKSKQLSIEKAPLYLVVQLKRFEVIEGPSPQSNKIVTEISFPLNWQLKTGQGEVNYELYATVLHAGDLGGGHYTADVKAGNAWYHADDSTIKEINAQVVLARNKLVYILFYKKTNGQ